MPWLLSGCSVTAQDITGFVKLGHPQPESNLSAEVKKRFSRNGIHIDAWFMVIPILSCKGPFGGGILGHVILLPGQLFLKLCPVLLYARSAVRTDNEVLETAEINMAVTWDDFADSSGGNPQPDRNSSVVLTPQPGGWLQSFWISNMTDWMRPRSSWLI